ncbi:MULTISPECIES: RDD family protein [unclassified Psychrobacillus]|uniref:RDD family protein n=1 Tax=unclassified Psychrobacillus TaxID=2636677 RepID=UPI0030F6111E
MNYAGFWIRFVANFIDGLVLMVPLMLLQFALMPKFLMQGQGTMNYGTTNTDMHSYLGLYLLIGYLITGAYYVLMTGSKHKGTLGKMAMSIEVVDEAGEGLTYRKSFVRYIGSILSGIILNIGYLMVAFHSQKRALHDLIANSYVVAKRK